MIAAWSIVAGSACLWSVGWQPAKAVLLSQTTEASIMYLSRVSEESRAMRIRFEEIAGPKSSAADNFELMCALLIGREFAMAKAVDGRGGDEGIDILLGTIFTTERIFQAKYFCSSITKSQKRQVIESLETAIQHHSPRHWTLCVPKDFSPAEERWFEEVRECYRSIEIDKWNATDLINKLLANPDIRYEFFPNNDLEGFDLISQTLFSRIRKDPNQSTSFFSGARPSWSDILSDHDVRRGITDTVLEQLSETRGGISVLLISSAGGSGKTTFLMRLGYELYLKGNIVLFQQRYSRNLNIAGLRKFLETLREKRLFVVVDDAARVENLVDGISHLAQLDYDVVFLLAGRSFEWRTKQEQFTVAIHYLNNQNGNPFQLDKLTDIEISDILDKLSLLGLIKRLPIDGRVRIIESYAEKSKRSALILMLLLLSGPEIGDVIQDEIGRLRRSSETLNSAYIYICLFTTLKAYATRAVLAALLKGPSTLRIISDLEGLIEDNQDRITARHDRIAELVIEQTFGGDENSLIEAISEVITCCTVSKEWDVIEGISVPKFDFSELGLQRLWSEILFAKAQIPNPISATNFLFGVSGEYWREEVFRVLVIKNFPLIMNLVLRCTQYDIEINWNELAAQLGVEFTATEKSNQIQYRSSGDELKVIVHKLGVIIYGAGDYKCDTIVWLANFYFEKMSQILPNEHTVFYDWGYFNFDFAAATAAVELFKKAVETNEYFAEGYIALCAAAHAARMPEIASDAFDRAYSSDIESALSDMTFADYVLEFLEQNERLEDYLLVSAIHERNSLEVVDRLSSMILQIEAEDLRLDKERQDYIKGMNEQKLPSDSAIQTMFSLSRWLRNQPIEVKQQVAKIVWKERKIPIVTPYRERQIYPYED